MADSDPTILSVLMDSKLWEAEMVAMRHQHDAVDKFLGYR